MLTSFVFFLFFIIFDESSAGLACRQTRQLHEARKGPKKWVLYRLQVLPKARSTPNPVPSMTVYCCIIVNTVI